MSGNRGYQNYLESIKACQANNRQCPPTPPCVIPGPTGQPGPPGKQGPPGPPGQQGSKGNAGQTGAQGQLGPTGAQGQLGPTGAQGQLGPTGAQGQLGPTGAQGQLGPTGAQGQLGPTGAQGQLGPTGAQGQLGPTGAQGQVGPTGAQGQVGQTGAQGQVGQTGAQGQVGQTGPIGSIGSSGGIVLFMNIDEIVPINSVNFYNVDTILYNTCSPTIKSTRVTNDIQGTSVPPVTLNGDYYTGSDVQFAIIDNMLSSTIIPPGKWDMHIWVRCAFQDVISLQWTLYSQVATGSFSPNPFAVSEMKLIENASQTSSTEVIIPLYIDKPVILCENNTRILLGLKAYTTLSTKPSISLYFESYSPSYIQTTLVPIGPTGEVGPTGQAGEVGPTGFTGPVGPLSTQILVADISSVTLTTNLKTISTLSEMTLNGLEPNTKYAINWFVNETGAGVSGGLNYSYGYLDASNVSVSSFQSCDLNFAACFAVMEETGGQSTIFRISGSVTDTITTNAGVTSVTFSLYQAADASYTTNGKFCIQITKTL